MHLQGRPGGLLAVSRLKADEFYKNLWHFEKIFFEDHSRIIRSLSQASRLTGLYKKLLN